PKITAWSAKAMVNAAKMRNQLLDSSMLKNGMRNATKSTSPTSMTGRRPSLSEMCAKNTTKNTEATEAIAKAYSTAERSAPYSVTSLTEEVESRHWQAKPVSPARMVRINALGRRSTWRIGSLFFSL